MSVLRKYGAGLALVGRTLMLELFGKRLKTGGAAPTNGQALVYSAADDAWSPGTVSGGSLPSGTLGSILAHDGAAWATRAIGTNGHVLRAVSGEPQWSALTAADVGAIAAPGSPNAGGVLAYVSGAWASTAAGTARQLLTSTGSTAPAWDVDVLPLTQRAIDGLGTSVTTCAVLAHDLSGGGGGAGIGARCELQARNSASTLVAAAAVDGVLTDATGGAEVGALDVSARSSGSLARVARFAPTGLRLDWAASAITVLASFGGTELDVWRVDGSSRWAYGSTDATNCGGLRLYTPSTADVAVYRGATAHWQVDSSGASILGTTSHATTLRGLRIVLSGPIAVHDASVSSVVTAMTIAHTLSSGTAAAGIGARATLAAHNAAGTLTDAVALDGVLTNTGAGTEAGALAISTRTAGGALTERARVHGTGGVTIGTATALSSGVGLASGLGLWGRNAADSAWINAIGITGGEVQIGDANNIGALIMTGATAQLRVITAGVVGFAYRGYLTASSGVQQQLKLSEPIEQTGTAGWTLLDLSPTLTTQGSGTKRAISYSVSASERFGIDENGCFVGLRLRRTAVSDSAHTVAGLSAYVDMRGLTAARTVTGPSSAVEGTVVVITNGDGSANGTNTVTFAPASGTVNGAATHVAISAAYGSCTYLYDGTNWTVIAKV